MNRLLLFMAVLALGTFSAPDLRADELALVLEKAREAEGRFDARAALALYLQADRIQPENAVTLQKIAQQLSDLTLETPGADAKKAQAERALAYAQRAVELAPDNAVNVLSLAVCYGKMAVFSDARAKIEYSRLVKQAAERAVGLDPNYDWAHHVLGRWHYEVAELGVATRWVVRLVYGGLPKAERNEAILHLETAVRLAPERAPHHLELGFAYAAAGRREDAKASFVRGLALPATERYDEAAKERARAALARL